MFRKMLEKTFATIKPHAVREGKTGKIIDRIEREGFNIVEMRKHTMTKPEAEMMYREHAAGDYFPGLIKDITAGPVILLCLEKENAILDWRKLIGKTSPKDADEGTLRKIFGNSRRENAVHGSDSRDSAAFELSIFFDPRRLVLEPDLDPELNSDPS